MSNLSLPRPSSSSSVIAARPPRRKDGGFGVAARRLPSGLTRLLLLAEWGGVLSAAALWGATRMYSPWVHAGVGLLLGAWVARWVRTGQIFRPTPIDFPLVLFLLSAAVGVWAAPDWMAAVVRLYLFIGAAGLYYLLVNSEAERLTLFSNALIIFAAVLGLYFVTQHDWAGQPAKFAGIQNIGLGLNQIIPDLGLYKPQPNTVAALLALTAPILLARSAEKLSRLTAKRAHVDAQPASKVAHPQSVGWPGSAALGLGGLIILFSLIMTQSRAAWLALVGALGLALWWRQANRLEAWMCFTPGRVFWVGVASAAAAWVVGTSIWPQLPTVVLGAIPGPSSVVERNDFYAQLWRLAQDTPFTGGGLAAFPALYSTYILDIPFLFLPDAQNAYLNLLVEQGWLGLIGYAAVLAAASWAAVERLRQADDRGRVFVAAGTLGLAVVVLQGFADASLTASQAILALLIPSGLALAQAAAAQPPKRPGATPRLWRWGLVLIITAALLVTMLVGRWSLLAAWHANRGAVIHNQIELAGWPAGKWNEGQNADSLEYAEPELQRALTLNPWNRTAHHRLGLAAALRRDFLAAAAHLQRAYEADSGHRGIIKALGYTYVWLGDYDRAAPLLAAIPEARQELEVYVWWWGAQGRNDLAERARMMVERMGRQR